jgi:CspA family cold shock protein
MTTDYINTTTETGTVKWFSPDKGYGFIRPSNGKQDVFVHISALKAAGLDNLDDNQKIEYEIVEERGKKSAGNIKTITT